jgi:hypothetical protein
MCVKELLIILLQLFKFELILCSNKAALAHLKICYFQYIGLW